MRKDEAYSLLNLNHGADEKTIKKAYRRAAAKYHPDKHHDKDEKEIKENESKFKEIKLAYEVLAGKVKEPDHFNNFNSYKDFNDMVVEAERRERQARMNGVDVKQDVSIDMYTAIHGGKIDFNLPVFITCPACNGQGRFGSNQFCGKCRGNGIETSYKKIRLKIHKNSYYGFILTMRGKGGPRRSPEGKDGNLLIRVVYLPDDYFKMSHHGLLVESYISLDIWLTGGEVSVASPVGEVSVKVPAMIGPDKILRVNGKGVGGTDLFVAIKVDNNYFKDEESNDLINKIGKSLKDRHINKDVDIFNLKTKNKLKDLKL